MDKKELKEITKEAIKEWLDDQFTNFGKWTANAMGALAFGALIYFILKMNGWGKT